MPDPLIEFSDEQSRTAVNLSQRYDAWIDAERQLAALPYDLRPKTVSGKSYLYEIAGRSGNGKSLGRMNVENQKQLDEYRLEKSRLKSLRKSTANALKESCGLYRALRLPLLASAAGAILREADRRYLLDTDLLVVGTNTLPAYAIEANGLFRNAPDETEDFDLAWRAPSASEETELPFWAMLKAVDSTYTINMERVFQARNAKAYEVELLIAPSKVETLGRRDQPKPMPLPEQEWLLLGRTVDRVVVCRDGSPARIVAPDPRWFALHKLWMSEQDKRDPLKRNKDALQGNAILDAVELAMPHYPLGDRFEDQLPIDLQPMFMNWRDRRPEAGLPDW